MLSCLKKKEVCITKTKTDLVTWLKIHRQLSKARGGADQFRNWEVCVPCKVPCEAIAQLAIHDTVTAILF